MQARVTGSTALLFAPSRTPRFQCNRARGASARSAGAHLASFLGTTDPSHGFEGFGGYAGFSSRANLVVGWSGLYDFPSNPSTLPPEVEPFAHFFLGNYAANHVAASPATYVSADDPPFTMLHGTADMAVPFTQALGMRNNLQANGVAAEVFLFPGQGHTFFTAGTPTFRSVMEYTERAAYTEFGGN